LLRRQRAHVLPSGELKLGARDVCLGEIGGCPFYIGGDQYERWQHTRLTLDVVPGRGSGFSLEASVMAPSRL
jgi:uncharacterized protein (DUF779 family)